MKLISISNISYLISLGIHLVILILFYSIIYEPQPSVQSFQASVIFENKTVKRVTNQTLRQQQSINSRLEDIPLSRQYKRTPSIRTKKSQLPRPNRLDKPDLRQYITPPKPKIGQKRNDAGYLRANKRTTTPMLPLIAEKAAPERPFEREITEAQLSGTVAQNTDKDVVTNEQTNLPVPNYTENSKKATKNKQSYASSIWQKKSELMIYKNSLAKLVTANWIVPQTSVKDFQIMVEAFIGPRGNLISIQLLKRSGLAVLDAAAERAIRVSTPFPVFPSSFDKNTQRYRAIFRFTPDKVAN